MLCPVAASANSLVPAGEQTGALGLFHLRGKGHIAVPQAADLVPVLPYTGGKARQIGCAQSGRLPDGRAQHGLVQDVGLELHQELVAGCAAIHLQRGDGHADVFFHSRHKIGALVGDGFLRRADDVVLGGAAGNAHNGTAGVHIPVRRTQTGKGGHDVNAAVVRHLLGVVFRVAAFLDHAQAVAHPLDDGTAYKDAALQRVLHPAVQADGDGRDQAVPAAADGVAGVHQQKAAGAVGVLGLALAKAALSEQRSLLVTGNAGHRDLHTAQIGGAVDQIGRAHV